MSGATEATAYRMITSSDDAAANALYLRAGGDAVVDLVGAHYGIADLGAPPPVPGRWGLTRITARGLVHLYAALAKDPAVRPWLGNAMRHAARVAADGTDQFFGLPSATPGAAVKQGWGHDGVRGGHAVINSTGYIAGGRLAVAILTAGPAGSYGAALQGVVTAQARALAAGLGRRLAAAAPAGRTGAVGAAPAVREQVHGGPAPVVLGGVVALAGLGAGSVLAGRRLRALREERSRRRGQGAGRRQVQSPLVGRLVRLPSGQVLRITAAAA
jgi:hypothetical protein